MNYLTRVACAIALCLTVNGASGEHWISSDDCKWGCTIYDYDSTGKDGQRHMSKDKIPYRSFYVRNEGPRAITWLAIAPSHFLQWGCAVWPFANPKVCSILPRRIERGTTAFFQILYSGHGDDPDGGNLHDIKIIDSADVPAPTAYSVHIPSSGKIPTIIFHSSDKNRYHCPDMIKGFSIGTSIGGGKGKGYNLGGSFGVNISTECHHKNATSPIITVVYPKS